MTTADSLEKASSTLKAFEDYRAELQTTLTDLEAQIAEANQLRDSIRAALGLSEDQETPAPAKKAPAKKAAAKKASPKKPVAPEPAPEPEVEAEVEEIAEPTPEPEPLDEPETVVNLDDDEDDLFADEDLDDWNPGEEDEDDEPKSEPRNEKNSGADVMDEFDNIDF